MNTVHCEAELDKMPVEFGNCKLVEDHNNNYGILIPRLTCILVPEKTVLCKNCVSGGVKMFQLTWNSPISTYIS